MKSARLSLREHSTARRHRLKLLIFLPATLLLVAASAPPGQLPGDPSLRAQLSELLRAGDTEAAVRRAQAALRSHPNDPGVRHEYVTLHLTLARDWLAARRYDPASSALAAVLATEPQQASALAMQRKLTTARFAAGQAAGEIDTLLTIELFEAALDRIKEVRALRPDLANQLAPAERAAYLGAADDHYLAGNFHEAFALYERLTAADTKPGPDLRSRWLLSLTLALGERDSAPAVTEDVARRLLARLDTVLPTDHAPVPAQTIRGLLAEQAGQLLDAGRLYAAALDTPWTLPPLDRRRDTVAALRREALDLTRDRYRATPTRRRQGFWTLALPDVWKHRQTPHFDVYARNDLIATRVAETLEYHYPHLATWLGIAPQAAWEPRLEVRVHRTPSALHEATGTTGDTRAVSDTRLQGSRILTRKLAVFQADQWLLSATLPRELTHALLADAYPQRRPPPALETGLALQAEPPARRLRQRRLLDAPLPPPAELLAARPNPDDLDPFYARSDAVTGWLLDRQAQRIGPTTDRAPIPALLAAFRDGVHADWWASFGWESSSAMLADWQAWVAARRRPLRMPLMLLVRPASNQPPLPEAAP